MAPKLKKQLPLIVSGLILIAFVAVAFFSNHEESGACGPYRTDKVAQINNQKIKLEQPKDQKNFTQGLGSRVCIEADRGMLFAFNKPSHYSFWMKDMRFPIDIVWLSPDRKVVGIEKKVEPSTYPDRFINKDSLAQYVLELQAGRASSLKLTTGTRVDF